VDADGTRSTWAILERYMENQGDAWTYTVNYVERFLDQLRATPEAGPARHTAYLGSMRTLGRRTAEFHRALALPDAAGAFGSERIGAGEITGWVVRVRRGMEAMFRLLEQELPQLPEAAQALGAGLLAARPGLYRRILRPAALRLEATKTRCHGDYRLGQVWVAANDFVIANYGGEPGLSWAERRRKHTPLRDVAGLLASLGEAGAAALDQVAGGVQAGPEQDQVDAWERLAGAAFFRSYRQAMAGCPSCPPAAAAEALVTLALAERAIAGVAETLAGHSPAAGGAMRRLLQVARRGR
jgi:maltose alpha-D-glucosyltransferase/alpha-amylase